MEKKILQQETRKDKEKKRGKREEKEKMVRVLTLWRAHFKDHSKIRNKYVYIDTAVVPGNRFSGFFLDRFFRCVRISIRGLVRLLVGPSVRRSVRNAFVQIAEKWTYTDSKLFRQCWTRKKEGRGGTRRKEGRGGRIDKEEGATRRVKQGL